MKKAKQQSIAKVPCDVFYINGGQCILEKGHAGKHRTAGGIGFHDKDSTQQGLSILQQVLQAIFAKKADQSSSSMETDEIRDILKKIKTDFSGTRPHIFVTSCTIHEDDEVLLHKLRSYLVPTHRCRIPTATTQDHEFDATKITCVDAARATSAAPTYFNPLILKQQGKKGHIFHGWWHEV